MRVLALLFTLFPIVANAAITHEETASNYADVIASDSLTVTMAGAASDGELLIGICHSDDAGVGTKGVAISFPTGWTKIDEISVATEVSRDRVIDVGYKIAASEGSSYVFNNNSDIDRETQCVIVVYSDVSAFQLHVTPTASHYVLGENDTDPDPPSITTTIDNAMVVALGTAGGVNDNTRVCAAPSGYTLRHGTTDPIDNAFVCVADNIVETAGAENPGAFTVTDGGATDDTYGAVVAISPASAGGNSVLFFTR